MSAALAEAPTAARPPADPPPEAGAPADDAPADDAPADDGRDEAGDAAAPAPSVLDRFLWAVVKGVDEEAVLGFTLTRRESRRLGKLASKKEFGTLTREEALEHFDLKLAADCVPLLKAAIAQKRAGWRGETT